MKYRNTILFLLLASLRVKEVNAVYVEGMVRLFRGEGNYDDSTGISSALTTHPIDGKSDAGITFVSDTPYGSKPRSVFNFNGNGRARGPSDDLPGGADIRTMVGWFKRAGGISGPFGYGMNVCGMAFYVLILSTGRVDLDYWCGGYNEGINPIMSSHVNMWYHIAVIWDGTNNIAYVNGVEIKRGTPDRLPNTAVK